MFPRVKYTLCMKCCNADCSLTFSTPKHLSKHMRLDHKMKDTCPYCSKVCTSASGLIHHVRTHTNEKPYFCPVHGCKFRTSTKHILRVHLTGKVHGKEMLMNFAHIFDRPKKRRRITDLPDIIVKRQRQAYGSLMRNQQHQEFLMRLAARKNFPNVGKGSVATIIQPTGIAQAVPPAESSAEARQIPGISSAVHPIISSAAHQVLSPTIIQPTGIPMFAPNFRMDAIPQGLRQFMPGMESMNSFVFQHAMQRDQEKQKAGAADSLLAPNVEPPNMNSSPVSPQVPIDLLKVW